MEKKEKQVIENVIEMLQGLLEEEVVDKKAPKKNAGKKAQKEEEVEEDIIFEFDGEEINLSKMTAKKLAKFAKDNFDVEFDSDDKDAMLADFVEYLNSLEEEGEEVEEEADENEEEEDPEEKYGLTDLSDDELKDILKEADLSTKGKRQALIDRIVEAIGEGAISVEEEEEGEEEEIQDDDRDPAIIKAEEKVEKDVRARITSGKLKMPKIKETLKLYYDGDAECSDCSGCSKEDQIACYVKIQQNFVDDDGAVHSAEEPYVRDGENWCCGRQLSEMDQDGFYCEICSAEYK